jgi:hypothetical protein
MSVAARTRFTWGATAAIPLLFLAIVPLQRGIDRYRASMSAPEELWVRSGTLLKTISMGYDALLADIYWTRAVQYYGGVSADEHRVDAGSAADGGAARRFDIA